VSVEGDVLGASEVIGVPAGGLVDVEPVDVVPRPLTAAELLGGGTGLQERERIVRDAFESGRWEAVRAQVPLRHPSQLYEALGEGLVLGVILWLVYRWSARRGHPLGAGFFGGVFMLGYGVARTLIELFRQPDAQFTDDADRLGTVLGPLTMGQTLSLLMIAVGIFLVVQGWRKRAARPNLST